MIRAILTIGIAVGCSIVASAAGCAMESAAGGRPFETQGLRVVARQPGPALLELDFRLSPPAEVTAATMLVNGRVLPASYIDPYPSPADLSAVLFLVDTSDIARERAIERNLRDIEALMDRGAAHHRFGLAGFDGELSILAPLGSAPGDIMAAARAPRVKGRMAQLNLGVIQAIDVLMAYPASRRALVIFSDGSAEDPDHSLEEALERANAAGVVILGLGHARTLRQSLGLQSLRLMASATGGAYAEAPGEADLPKSFLADPFRALDNGGRATFDLSAAGPGPGDGSVVARVVFHTVAGDKVIDILVTLPPAYWDEALWHPDWDVLIDIDVLVTFPRGDSDRVLRPRKKPCRAHKPRRKATEERAKCRAKREAKRKAAEERAERRAARRDRREADEERTQRRAERKAERKAAEAEAKREARRRVKHKAAEARAQHKAERRARREARREAGEERTHRRAARRDRREAGEERTHRRAERRDRREAGEERAQPRAARRDRREANEEEEEKQNAGRRRGK